MTGLMLKCARLCLCALGLAASVAAAPVVGRQRVLVVVTIFPETTTEPSLVGYHTTMAKVDTRVRQDSYALVSLDVTVVGPYRVAEFDRTFCNVAPIQKDALAQMQAQGIDPTAYPHHVLSFPKLSTCNYSGAVGLGNWALINGSFGDKVVAHEFYHTLALKHDNRLRCEAPTTTYNYNCTSAEYGNTLSVMGSTTTGGSLPLFSRLVLGWVGAPDTPPVTVVTGPMTTTADYTFSSLSAPADGQSKGLDVWQPTLLGPRLHIEQRTAVGVDAFVSGYPAFATGVLVTIGNDALDFTPATSTMSDGALQVGATWVQPGVATITVLSVSGTASVVRIGPPPPPAITLSVPSVTVRWTGLPLTLPVSIKRNGAQVAIQTKNTGTYIDAAPGVAPRYEICTSGAPLCATGSISVGP